jgi:hypothetical protein
MYIAPGRTHEIVKKAVHQMCTSKHCGSLWGRGKKLNVARKKSVLFVFNSRGNVGTTEKVLPSIKRSNFRDKRPPLIRVTPSTRGLLVKNDSEMQILHASTSVVQSTLSK